jgi:voltage-gated potassium channel
MRPRFTGERLANLKLRGVVGVIVLIAVVVALAGGLVAWWVDPGIGSFGDSLWWATSAVTTVGFGDVVPTNTAGRIVGVVVMLTGISLIPAVTSLVVTIFIAQRQQEQTDSDRLHREEVIRRLDRLEQRIVSGQAPAD